MMMDQRRVEAYKVALEQISKGKVVVDVGAGTGVLSIFAAEFEAKKVFAIENADIFKRCKKEVNKKNL
jgi:predicted RNA methylase